MFTLLEHTACESTYQDSATGEKIRLWAIVGGQLAVAFNDFECTERLNYCEKFDSNKDSKWPLWQGPRLEDVTGGELRIQAWYDNALAIRKLRRERFGMACEALHMPNRLYICLKSRRFHDLDNRKYLWCKLEINNVRIGPVTFTYAGQEITKWVDAKWKALAEFFNPLFDANMGMTWDTMSEATFQSILAKLKEYA